MDVDAEELDEEEALRSTPYRVLQLRSYEIDSDLSILVCKDCGCGVPPKSMIVHLQTHSVKLTKPCLKNLNTFTSMIVFAETSNDFKPPPNDQAPIDYIRIQDGLKCNACRTCAGTTSTMDTHWNIAHKDIGGISAKDYSKCLVQAIFSQRPTYFSVKPVLKGLGPQDKYRLYLSQLTGELASSDASFPPAKSDKEVPPLLRVTLWHDHLALFTIDKKTIRGLRSLLDTREAEKNQPWLGKRLYQTVQGYMKDIKAKIGQIPIPALMLLMQYPRQVSLIFSGWTNRLTIFRDPKVSDYYRKLGNEDSYYVYGHTLHQFALSILLTIDNPTFPYQFTLSEEDRERGEELIRQLQLDSGTTPLAALHSFLRPLCLFVSGLMVNPGP